MNIQKENKGFLNIALNLFNKTNKTPFLSEEALIHQIETEENNLKALSGEKTQEELQATLIEEKHKKAIEEQNELADSFLNAGVYEHYFSMSKNGYQATNKQARNVNNHIIDLIENNSLDKVFPILESYTKNGFTLNIFQAQSFFKNFDKNIFTKAFFENREVIFNSPEFSEQFHNAVRSDSVLASGSFSSMLFERTNEKLGVKYNKYDNVEACVKVNIDCLNSYSNYFYLTQSCPDIFLKNISLKNYLGHLENIKNEFLTINRFFDSQIIKDFGFSEEFIDTLQNNSNNSNNSILSIEPEKSIYYTSTVVFKMNQEEILKIEKFMKDNIINGFYKDDIKNKLQKTKDVYQNHYLEHIENNLFKTQELYKLSDLPQDTQALLKNIEVLSQKLIDTKKFLDESEQFDIQNILDKRLPEAIVKYLKIDADYRTTMKNSAGHTAQDLMMDTIKNYHHRLDSLYAQTNENQLSELSSANRYSKMKI